MSNSSLVDYTRISPNSTNPRSGKISKITIHHMAGNLSVEACASVFATTDRQASSNYGIGTDGRVGLYVEEKNRAWTSSNRDNDNVAVTIEVANDEIGGNWHVSDKALSKLIDLCVDICKRNSIERLNYTGDKSGNLTMHKWFTSTLCPGPYLESKFQYIADEVNKRLCGSEQVPNVPSKPADNDTKKYHVQVGAYSNLQGAKSCKEKINSAGFKAYIVRSADGLFKVHAGAFDDYQNAKNQVSKLKAAGYNSFITTQAGEKVDETSCDKNDGLNVGDKVKLVEGATYTDGRSIPSWVFAKTCYVRQFYSNGDVVFSTLPIGAITGVVARKYLTKV